MGGDAWLAYAKHHFPIMGRRNAIDVVKHWARRAGVEHALEHPLDIQLVEQLTLDALAELGCRHRTRYYAERSHVVAPVVPRDLYGDAWQATMDAFAKNPKFGIRLYEPMRLVEAARLVAMAVGCADPQSRAEACTVLSAFFAAAREHDRHDWSFFEVNP